MSVFVSLKGERVLFSGGDDNVTRPWERVIGTRQRERAGIGGWYSQVGEWLSGIEGPMYVSFRLIYGHFSFVLLLSQHCTSENPPLINLQFCYLSYYERLGFS